MRRVLIVPILAVLLLAALPAATQAGGSTPAFSTYAAPSSLGNSNNAGEPSIGVDPATDSAFFQAFASTYKINFPAGGSPTWQDVTAPQSVFNLDPILVTDRATGRTYAGGIGPACSLLQYTDDDGALWVQEGNACALPAFDHESIGVGPWHGTAPLGALSNRAVYYCAQDGTDECSTSMDGGLTFGAPVSIPLCQSFHGHVKVSADGTAYVPSAYCGSRQGGFSTNQNGKTWLSYTIPGSRTSPTGGGFDPSVATTPDNTLYEAWADGVDQHPWVGRSTTHGATWDRLTDLASTVSPAITASTFQAVVAGNDGSVAVAFLGSTTGTGSPFAAGYHGVWDLYVSFSYDGGLTWSTVKATSDPVQRGCIYDVSPSSGSCHRNLLDFMDASVTAGGAVVVAFADGCVSSCLTTTTNDDQWSDAYATIAVQTGGTGLFGGPATP
ncbi:MAG: hypothetical protein QOE90_43 [Thermoplasmata archaeon]|jgi:hypothetical protein|nr:hypothetical protein [Thermoplasmata archaeon]